MASEGEESTNSSTPGTSQAILSDDESSINRIIANDQIHVQTIPGAKSKQVKKQTVLYKICIC
jgi:hypothetical protein